MPRQSSVSFDVLSSMVAELVKHHERYGDIATEQLDWQSSTKLTQIICYSSCASLHPILNQVPDAIAAEYKLIHKSGTVHQWKEYRWPHLQATRSVRNSAPEMLAVPDLCFSELLNYHQDAQTGWLDRYQATLTRDNAA